MIASLRQTAQVRPELDDVELPTFVVTSDEEAAAAIDQIIEYFGQDSSRTVVRLMLENDDPRYLVREDMDVYVLEEEKGFGESASPMPPPMPPRAPAPGADPPGPGRAAPPGPGRDDPPPWGEGP